MSIIQKSAGFSGPIVGLKGQARLVARLQELGFIQGEIVTLKGTAPMGDPFIVQIRGTTLALRRQEAECILV